MTQGRFEICTSGTVEVHSQAFHIQGPKSLATAANSWPDARFNEQFVVRTPEGKPVARMRYRLRRDDGTVIEGVTGADGLIPMQKGVDPASLHIDLLGLEG